MSRSGRLILLMMPCVANACRLAWENIWKGMTGGGAADACEVARGERDLAQFAGVFDAHLAGRCADLGRLCDCCA